MTELCSIKKELPPRKRCANILSKMITQQLEKDFKYTLSKFTKEEILKWKDSTVLITGCAGFLGYYLKVPAGFYYANVFWIIFGNQESNVSKISFQMNLSCAVMRFQSKLLRNAVCASSSSSSCFLFLLLRSSKKVSLYWTASSV